MAQNNSPHKKPAIKGSRKAKIEAIHDKQRLTKAQLEAKDIVNDASAKELSQIKKLLKNSRLERVKSLMGLLRNGTGSAKIQAEARIAVIEEEIRDSGIDMEIDLDWDIVATTEALGPE